MRCLTLAKALKVQNVECTFICRNHAGNLIKKIQQAGFIVHILDAIENDNSSNELLADNQNAYNKQQPLFHADWLGTTQRQDAQDCSAIIEPLQVDWLIVDHYALDKTWQHILRPHYKKLMVIDDLGDREHLADLLLDQNHGSTVEKYQELVPRTCTILAGSTFALLRPEFSLWRKYSLSRRKNNTSISNILVTLGGTDPDNFTGKILQKLALVALNSNIEIIVVMGSTAPHLQVVQQQAASMITSTIVKVDVSNMAEIMSNADLAVGAAGATTWERCCLGLPTIQIVTAENQRQIAEDLATNNVIKLLRDINDLTYLMATMEKWLLPIATQTHSIVDGLGCERVVDHMIKGYQL